MTIRDYQTSAMETCLPSANNISYMTLGLAGEAGEVANKVKKLIRDGDTSQLRSQIADELGDVLWYLAGCATVLGRDLNWLAEQNLAKLRLRQEQGKINGSGDQR